MRKMHLRDENTEDTIACGEGIPCEECGDNKTCDIYYSIKGYNLIEEAFIENWHERRDSNAN